MDESDPFPLRLMDRPSFSETVNKNQTRSEAGVEVHPARCQRCSCFSEYGLYRVHYLYQNMTVFSDFLCYSCAVKEEARAGQAETP